MKFTNAHTRPPRPGNLHLRRREAAGASRPRSLSPHLLVRGESGQPRSRGRRPRGGRARRREDSEPSAPRAGTVPAPRRNRRPALQRSAEADRAALRTPGPRGRPPAGPSRPPPAIAASPRAALPGRPRGRDGAGGGGGPAARGAGQRVSAALRVAGGARAGTAGGDRGRFRSGAGGSPAERGGHSPAPDTQMCARPAPPPPARPGERKDGALGVRAAPPPAPAPSGATPSGPGAAERGAPAEPASGAQAAASAPAPRAGSALTSVPSAGRAVPGRAGARGPGEARRRRPLRREGGPSGAAARAPRCRRSRRAEAQPARPGWIPSPTPLGRPPRAGRSRPSPPPPPAPRVTHPAPGRAAPRAPARTLGAAHASLGFCICSHARSDTDPFPPHALPSCFPTPLSRRIPVQLPHFACRPHTNLLARPQTSTSLELPLLWEDCHSPHVLQESHPPAPRRMNFAPRSAVDERRMLLLFEGGDAVWGRAKLPM